MREFGLVFHEIPHQGHNSKPPLADDWKTGDEKPLKQKNQTGNYDSALWDLDPNHP
jgi:hypothetical protein